MSNKSYLYTSLLAVLTTIVVQAQIHIPMEIRNGVVTETYSLRQVSVQGCRTQVSVPAAVGEGWRTDGYCSYISIPIQDLIPKTTLGVNMKDSVVDRLTISLWCAMETYPMMTPAMADDNNPLFCSIATTIDDSLHTGWGFEVSNTGRLRFRCYSSGWHIQIDAPDKLSRHEWHHLVATIDGYNERVTLYDNGLLLGQTRCMYDAEIGTKPLLIGKNEKDTLDGMFPMSHINGIIDEIRVDTGIWNALRIAEDVVPQHAVDMSVPMSAYANDICRPRYHGMPSQCWTNESHGMCYENGRWHIFFQKNGNGPYMSRLHWGHISSPDLCHWHEEAVALAPELDYDRKGCWSGCIVRDEITGGQPWALYSAISDSHCELMFANPLDANLIRWNKQGAPAIRCSFVDDFRDPYFFRANGKPYIIVGCADQGLGIATLQRYDNGNWTSDGDIFFKATATADAGSFWEMPTITPIGDKWLFTCTPMSTSRGVRTLYWTGQVDGNGHFVADYENPRTVELEDIAIEGYGLLSPTICQHEGKTIALGIVPDKVSSTLNYTLGWAHLYSFPREWSIDNGELVQRPYSGLHALRTDTTVVWNNRIVTGGESLSPIMGRSIELCGSFLLDTAKVGFTLLQNTYGGLHVYLDPQTGELVVDMTTISRRANDTGLFDGMYRASIPQGVSAGQTAKLDVWFDHSILDIFVNDRYATSIRVYPYDYSANGCSVYVNGGQAIASQIQAWGLGHITHYRVGTDLEQIYTTPTSKTRKYMYNKQLIIQHNEKQYNILGNRL